MDTLALYNETALINDIALREAVLRILISCDVKHETAPASSTGKYHPAYALGEGGLIRHTKAVVTFAVALMEASSIEDTDNIIAAAILHDMCKYEGHSLYTRFEHPNLMYRKLCDEGYEEVGDIVHSHMGKWNRDKRSSVVLPLPTTPSQLLLHQADYLASRKYIDVCF